MRGVEKEFFLEMNGKPVTTYIYSSEPVRFTWTRPKLEPNQHPAHLKPFGPYAPQLLFKAQSVFILFSYTPRLTVCTPCMHLYFISRLFIFYAFYFHCILFRSISYFYLCFMHFKLPFAFYFSLSLHFIYFVIYYHSHIYFMHKF